MLVLNQGSLPELNLEIHWSAPAGVLGIDTSQLAQQAVCGWALKP